MRHAEVSYFGTDGKRVNPSEVSLNEEGIAQARAAAEALAEVELDRVVTSGLPRSLETAAIVAPKIEPEVWPELTEIRGGRLSEIPPDALQHEFVHAFRGVIPNETRFLRGESIGELFDRVLPALGRLTADEDWHTALAVLHGGVNRAIMAKYAPSANANDQLYIYGVAKAETFVQALYKAGKNPTRAGLMAALLSMNSENKFALPGVVQKTSKTDHWIISQMQLEQYTSPDWKLQGKLIEGRPR